MLRAFGMHGQAVQHAGLPDGEIADVDHLLHFAVALGLDLAHFERYEAAERILVLAQRVADASHGFATNRAGNLSPGLEGLLGSREHLLIFSLRRLPHAGDDLVVRGADRVDQRRGVVRQRLVAEPGAVVDGRQAKRLENW